MKKLAILSMTAAALSTAPELPAGVVVLNTPGVTLTAGQPVTAVFTDANGNTVEQQVYYNANLGGVDIGNTAAYTSVYFPTMGSSYIWYNGNWVGQDGYYWNNGARVYVGPQWHDHWNGYWGNYHGGWHDGWRGGDNHYRVDNHYDVHVHEDRDRGNWHHGEGGHRR